MIVVAGTVRLAPDHLDVARPHMADMIAASLAEDGCHAYSYAVDVLDPTVVHVFEIWRDRAALDAHLRTPHIGHWRAQWAAIGLSDRNLSVYEVVASRAV